ncbi:MAG: hypothetical protein ABI051_08010 [Vicinamibacterales bacterium]
MTIREIIRQGLHYARTCKWLWLFGFFIGITSGGSGAGGGSHNGGGGGVTVGVGPVRLPIPTGATQELVGRDVITHIAPIIIAVLVAIVIAFVMRFVSEGALIVGIARARQGGTMTNREGWRAGWTHWGVLLRIALLYVGATIGTLVLVAAACGIGMLAFGTIGAVLTGIVAFLIAVPWLVTLYLVQAFALRIAVLENRGALDAMRKARLFVHGRLMHGLKLIVAMFVGTLVISGLGLLAMAPVALLLAALIPVLHIVPVIVLGCVVLVPALCVLSAIVGTFRSSVWTIGYVTQVGG